MDIEDDFIEDSEKIEEEEENNEEDNNIFLTGTKNGLHKEIILKPAVNIYPIATLSQQLVSRMYSLEMFGQSDIGTTVPGSVYDLGKHFKSLYDSFPTFIQESNVYSNSRLYFLQKQFDGIKSKIARSQQINKKIKDIIRNNERRLPNLNKPDDNEFSELDRAKSEMKATAISLKKSIEKLQTIKKENDQLQSENETTQQQIDSLLSQFRHKCTGETGQIKKNIVKIDIELRENLKKYRENVIQAQKIVNAYNDPIHSLEVRISDMNHKISVCSRPVRLPKISRR